MNNLKEIIKDEIKEFRKFGQKFIDGEMNVADFKKESGGMGVYVERGVKKFAIRLRMPSGVTSLYELNKIYEFAKRYKLDKVHLTTRQAIQLHSMEFEDVCDLMEECLEYNIFTRGSGGNFPRNVALSPLAGVDRDEAFDTTDIALAVGNYFLERVYTYKLPRKLKVSFSGTEKDKGHVTVQDLGFLAVNNNGKNTFTVYAGGGLGMNPKKAVIVEENVDPSDVLFYVEGMVKFFMAEGDYNNKARARVRYILERMGEEEFIKEYKKYVEAEKINNELKLNVVSKKITKLGMKTNVEHKRLYNQKQEGLYSVYIHPLGGQLKIDDLKILCEFLKDKEDIDLRLAMVEGLYVRNLNGKEAEELLEISEKFSENFNVMQSVSCIGLPICQMGRCNSQKLLKSIVDYLKEKNYQNDVLPRIYISGCPNSCAVHEIGAVGFMGLKVKSGGEFKEAFRLYIGGRTTVGKTELGIEKGDFLPERIPEFLYRLSKKLEERKIKFMDYINEEEEEFNDLINEFQVEK